MAEKGVIGLVLNQLQSLLLTIDRQDGSCTFNSGETRVVARHQTQAIVAVPKNTLVSLL